MRFLCRMAESMGGIRMAKEVWEEETYAEDAKTTHANSMIFPIGQPNDAFAKYFIGQSYLAPISTEQVGIL